MLSETALLSVNEFSFVIGFALKAISNTVPFILFAVLALAYIKAPSAENVITRALEGTEGRMVILAALLGDLSPFCSYEVIPFIATLLAVKTPLSAVMAFWLTSPLMDQAMFLITSGTSGWHFKLAKTIAAIGIGFLGGGATMIFTKSVVFADRLREKPRVRGYCSAQVSFQEGPRWSF